MATHRRPCVLIAVGNPESRMLLRSFFVYKCHHTYSTEDGEQALLAVLTGQYEIIVMDTNIRQLGALEVLGAIRMKNPHFPVVLVATRSDSTLATNALQLGVSEILEPPLTWKTIEGCMQLISGVTSVNPAAPADLSPRRRRDHDPIRDGRDSTR